MSKQPFLFELERAKREIKVKMKEFDSFDLTSTARVFNALKEAFPEMIFGGPLAEKLPRPHSDGSEEYCFVVAKDRETFLKHEEDR